MKKINLIYWNSKNFGDILNPRLIEELTGIKVQYKHWLPGKKRWLRGVADALTRLDIKELRTIIFPWQDTFICVGSIINRADRNSKIWGAGFMNEFEAFRGGDTYAVRGTFTNDKLKRLGFSGCDTFGDPALLLPLWIKPNIKKIYKLGIIPHWKEVDFFKEHYGKNYHIIDLRTDDIQGVVEEISSCAKILSTSLHGLIVGQAYNVPSLWIKKGYIDTDGFKFDDYFSSVNIPPYDGFEDIEGILKEEASWEALFAKNIDKGKINTSLAKIQSDLLRSAPFPLKNKYLRFVQQTAAV